MEENCLTIIETIKTEMKKSGLNARELAEKALVGKSFVYDILSGKSTNPTSKKLRSIAKVLKIPVSKLIAADEMLSTNIKNVVPVLPVDINHKSDCKKSDTDPLMYLPLNNKFSSHNPSCLQFYIMNGDVMEPTLMHNDMLLIDISDKIPHPAGLFAIIDDLGISIKRLECIMNQDKELKLHVISDNNKYSSYYCNKEDVTVFGRVVRYCRNL